MAGGTKHNGCYYLTGQGGNHFGGLRQLVTYVSYDFEHWSEASVMGFRRHNIPPRPMVHKGSDGPQVHLGAGLWNRGNVILGFYGQWNGHPSNDRRLLTMDLGLVVTNDALHYREPVPDFPIVSAAEDGWDILPRGIEAVDFPALIQGQGFENVGEETLFWYAPWPEQDSDGVRVANWQRDRLGHFQAFYAPRMANRGESHFVSAPLDLEGKPARVFINLTGISEYSQVSVELVDEQFNKIPHYTKQDCQSPQSSGLRVPITWQGRETIEGISGPVRVRINFNGLRPEDLRVYAVYVEEA